MGQVQVIAGSIVAEMFIGLCYLVNIERTGKDALLVLGIIVAIAQLLHLGFNINERWIARKDRRNNKPSGQSKGIYNPTKNKRA